MRALRKRGRLWIAATALVALAVGSVASFTANPTNIYNVVSFGATCDGITNDFTPIWSAVQVAHNTGGGIVMFPAATCVIGAPMNLLSNVTLQGQGVGRTVLKYGINSGTTMLSTVNDVPNPSYVTIRDMTMTGPGAAIPSSRAVDLINCSFCTVENVEFSTWSYYGIFLQSTSDNKLDNLWIHDITQAAQPGIGGTALHIFYGNTRLTATNISTENTDGDGIWVNAGTTHGTHIANTDLAISNVTIKNFGNDGTGHAGLGMDGMQDSTITNVVIDSATQPTLQQNDGLLLAENQGQIAATGNVISNVFIYNVGTYCLEIRSASHNRFSNITCVDPMQAAGALGATPYGIVTQDAVVIAGNTVFDTTDNVIDGMDVRIDNATTLSYAVLWGNQTTNTFRNVVRNLHLDNATPTIAYDNIIGANTPIVGANANKVILARNNESLVDATAQNTSAAVGLTLGTGLSLTASNAVVARICNGDPDNGGTCPFSMDKNGNITTGGTASTSGVQEAAVIWAVKAYRDSVANTGAGIADVDFTCTGSEIEMPYVTLSAARTITCQCHSTQGSFGNTTINAQFPYIIRVADNSGSASPTNTISFKGTGAQTVTKDGVTSGAGAAVVVVNAPGGAATIKCDGANWTVIEHPSDGSLQGRAVSAAAPANTNVLAWSAANSDWEPAVATGAISSVSNSDGTLTISPTTGAVVASLALGHANTWTAPITIHDGTGTNTGVVGGTGFANATPVPSVTTGTIDGQSWTIPGNTLSADGMAIHCTTAFLHANTANIAVPNVLFNGSAFVGFNDSTNNDWIFDRFDVTRMTSTTALVTSTVFHAVSNSDTSTNTSRSVLVTGLDWTTNKIVKNTVTGATTNGDLTAEFLRCEWSSN